MARRGNFRSNIPSRGSKRLTDWLINFEQTALLAVPANSKVLVASIAAATMTINAPFTIIRTRGALGVFSDQTAAAEQQLGAIGITLVSDLARAAGVASLPGPATDSNWEGWFWHQWFVNKLQIADATGFAARGGVYFEVDSKAMRKVDSSDALVIVAENSHATHAFEIGVSLRILTKAG